MDKLRYKIHKVSNRKFQSGITLVEVLLSVGILVFALCTILALYISCYSLITTSKNTNIATNAALGLMEEIRGTAFSQIVTDYNGMTFILNEIPAPNSMGIVYVDDTNPELLNVTISVCWRNNNRVIGEDANLNGVLNAGEDANGNGIIDSPVQLVSLIVNR